MPIMEAAERAEWSLSEAAREFGEHQPWLIYLRETGVIRPDLQDAGGGGLTGSFPSEICSSSGSRIGCGRWR